jgi:glucose/arabinose dehydrogenase
LNSKYRNYNEYVKEHIKGRFNKSKASTIVLSLLFAFILFFSSTLTSLLTSDSILTMPKVFAQTPLRPLVSNGPPPEALIINGLINSGKPPSPSNFKLPPGYKIQPVLWNLTLPSSVTFDDNGSTYISESGYSYGGFKPIPRILKVDSAGTMTVLSDRLFNGPITDIEWNHHNAAIYVAHRGVISAVDGRGRVKDLVVGLPAMGDHQTNQIAFGPDGKFYFGQGTVTNTGVAGEDSYAYEWLKTSPEIHDVPAKNITLTGQNFQSANPLDPQNLTSYATTGAFVPFGHSTTKGQEIAGNAKCGGCIISANANGTGLKVVAWGLRNPYGVAITTDNKKLIVANNGADDRGSRPIASDPDKVYSLDISSPSNFGKWLGWPDFFGNGEPVTLPKFKSISSPDNKQPQFLMASHPPLQKPLGLLPPVGVAVTQVAISNSTKFGFKDMAFIGEFGTAAPLIHPFADSTQKVPGFPTTITGQKVVMVNPNTGNATDFISLKHRDPSFRPVGIKFNLQGDAMYVVSFGKTEIRTGIPGSGAGLYPFGSIHGTVWAYPNTGVVWKVTKIDNGTSAPPGSSNPINGTKPAITFQNGTTGRVNNSLALSENGTTGKALTGFTTGAPYLRIPLKAAQTGIKGALPSVLPAISPPTTNANHTSILAQNNTSTTAKNNAGSNSTNKASVNKPAKRPFGIPAVP